MQENNITIRFIAQPLTSPTLRWGTSDRGIAGRRDELSDARREGFAIGDGMRAYLGQSDSPTGKTEP
jgi:hypothetical protein